jgi:hypothetical protein
VPKFDDHIIQAKRNLAFLEIINASAPQHIDWQVTVCFYAALHLVNAHLAKNGQQYRTHIDVKAHISPFGSLPIMAIPKDEYAAYESLFSLSRRARYLVNETEKDATDAAFTKDKHLAKAIRHLECLCSYFSNKYKIEFSKTRLVCPYLVDDGKFSFFLVNK